MEPSTSDEVSFAAIETSSKTLVKKAHNVGGNPVAAFDADVSNDTIGDLGSPLCSSLLCLEQ